MDPNEIAARLDRLRQRIRAELAGPLDQITDGLPAPPSLELGERQAAAVPGEPNLNTTEHLKRANERAVLTGPVSIRSGARLLGPLLDVVRRLARPIVQPFIDPYLDRQERFNVEAVRHLNELGVRLEERLGAIYEALVGTTADPRRLEARLEMALADYDDSLRTRHVVLFDALDEEIRELQSALRSTAATWEHRQHLFEVGFVQRSEQVDRRFDELMRAASAAPAEAELMETRARLDEVLAAAFAADRSAASGAEATAEGSRPAAGPYDRELWQALREWLDDQDYRAFQEQFRGETASIEARLRNHVDRFAGAPGPVVDLGCGRGEFVALLAAAGLEAKGVEINTTDVADARGRDLDVVQADLFDWLEQQSDAALGGIFLAQVIEHLPPPTWSRLLRLAATRLAPGGRVVIETINPESVYGLTRAYVMDPTHIRPVHPELLSFLARRAGFGLIDVHFQAPIPDSLSAAAIDAGTYLAEPLTHQLVLDVNERLARLGRLCCASQEYTLEATRPRTDDAPQDAAAEESAAAEASPGAAAR